MTVETIAATASLSAVEGALVALPSARPFRRLARFRNGLARLRSPWFALVLPGSIAACVIAVCVWHDAAKGLADLALMASPPLAALSLGYAVRGARRRLIGLVPVLVGLIVLRPELWAAGAASVALTSLSAISLAAVVTSLTPLRWMKRSIVAMCVLDVVLVATGVLGPVADLLNAAAPGHGLPQLQSIDVGGITQGYGDLFLAAVLGRVIAIEGRGQIPIALLTLVLAMGLDSLLEFADTLPATVPAAVALLVRELYVRAARRLKRQPLARGPLPA